MISIAERNGTRFYCGEGRNLLQLIFLSKDVHIIESAEDITFLGTAAAVTEANGMLSVMNTHKGRLRVTVEEPHVIHTRGRHLLSFTLDRPGESIQTPVGSEHSVRIVSHGTPKRGPDLLLIARPERKKRKP